MNKNESKYFNTAILFDEALLYLLEKKDIEYITVSEICTKAGVNRSTFYLHYESINDLVEETLEYMNKKFNACFSENEEEFINKIKILSLEELNFVNEKYLTPYLNFIKENKKIFKASFNSPNGMRVIKKYNFLNKCVFNPILERFDISENERKYLITFYINGIMAIVKEWINNGCEDSIKDIENIIIKCINRDKES